MELEQGVLWHHEGCHIRQPREPLQPQTDAVAIATTASNMSFFISYFPYQTCLCGPSFHRESSNSTTRSMMCKRNASFFQATPFW